MSTISTMSRFARAMSINTLVLTSIKASLKTPEQHKHDSLTKNKSTDMYRLTTLLTCAWALNYTGSPVIKD